MQGKRGNSVHKERFKSNRAFKIGTFLHLTKQNLRTSRQVSRLFFPLRWTVTIILLNISLAVFISFFEASLTQKHQNLHLYSYCNFKTLKDCQCLICNLQAKSITIHTSYIKNQFSFILHRVWTCLD